MEKKYSLTLPQRPVWFEQKLYPHSAIYNIGGYIKIKGDLNTALFKKALQSVIRENDIFKIRFSEADGVPVQHFGETEDHEPDFFDLSGEAEPEKACISWMQNRHKKPFPPGRNPLFYFALLKEDQGVYYWYIKLHHLLIDGWGISVLVKKVAEAYSGCREDAKSFRYSDYIEDNCKYTESGSFRKDQDYWTAIYKTLPPPLNLGSLKREHRSPGSSRKTIFIKRDIYDRLLALSAEMKVSVFHVLLGALYTYVSRYTGISDIVFGLPVLNRGKASYKSTIGLFAGITPFRLSADPRQTFSDLLLMIRNGVKETYKYQQFPLDEIIRGVKQAGYEGDLFEISFSYEKHDYDVKFGDAETERLALPHNEEKLPLAVYVREYDGQRDIQIDFDYNLSCWQEFHIEQLVRHYGYLLNTITEQSHKTLAGIEILPEDDRKQQLFEFNRTRKEYFAGQTFLHLFAESVNRFSSAPALKCGNETLTYAELDRKSSELASCLRKKGAGPETCVAILAKPSMEMIIGMLGVLKAGAAFLPVDHNNPDERVSFMLRNSGALLLLKTPGLEGRLPGTGSLGIQEILSGENGTFTAESKPSQLAYVVYTSGSTGEPKGIMTEHRSLLNLCLWFNEYYGVGSSDRATKYAAFSFDASVFEVFPYLLAGASVYIVPDEIKLDMIKLNAFYEENKISISFLPTPVCEQFMQHENRSLRILYTGGDKLKTFTARNYKLYNNYGPAENTVVATSCEVKEEKGDIPVGRPVHNTRVFIMDPEKKLLPVGSVGELCISGCSLARGYLNNPGLTAEKFTDNPYFTGERLYHTGDLARWRPEGTIEYVGRKDEQVKIRGSRIEIAEIEKALYTCKGVKEAVISVSGDPSGNKFLSAYITAERSLTEEAVKDWLSRKLPDYMIPSFIIFMDRLPLSPNGKIDRSALPVPGFVKREMEITEPRTEKEKVMLLVWKDILGIREISIRDNFFSLGGDSIKAIQVSSRLRAKNFSIDVKDIFEYPTIEKASHQLKELDGSFADSSFTGDLPLLPIQKWFFSREFPAENHWNQSVLLECSPRITADMLEKVFKCIIESHEALRITFSRENNEIRQRCHSLPADFSFTLPVFDYSGDIDYKRNIERTCDSIQSSLDLSVFPLMKAAFFRTITGNYLFLTIHHLVTDGISWRVLIDDTETICRQLLQNKDLHLPARTAGLKQWTDALAEFSAGPLIMQEIPYWRKLQGAGIKYDNVPKSHSVDTRLQLGIAETEELKEVNAVFGTNTQDILLCALLLSLKEKQDTDSILITLESHGRENINDRTDISRTMGWFTAFFPVIFDVSAESCADLIKHVKEQIRKVPRKGMGYNILRYQSPQKTGNEKPDEVRTYAGFNYLGEFAKNNDALFSITDLPCGNMQSPAAYRLYPVDVNAVIKDQRLFIDFSFDSQEYSQAAAERFSSGYTSNLKHVMQYCLSRNEVEYTPSDFGDTGLDMNELDNILGQISKI